MDTPTLRAAIHAECECCHADVLDDILGKTDEMVAKSLAVSEIARIARLEMRTRDMYRLKWNVRAKQAAFTAGRVMATGGTLAIAFKQTDAAMSKWKGDVATPAKRNLSTVYSLARIAGTKRAKGKIKSLQYAIVERIQKAKSDPSFQTDFDLVDEKAIETLAKQEMMWIGDVWAAVGPTVRAAVKPSMLKGLSNADAGKMVADAVGKALKDIRIPDGFSGSSDSYFEGLAANAITNARVQGQLESFSRLGVEKYEIVNPMDERTTPICQLLNGQVFYVSDAMSQLAEMRAATTPDEYKAAHPWLPFSKIKELSKKGSKFLVNAGQAFPPYHFRCRSTVDISDADATMSDRDVAAETG